MKPAPWPSPWPVRGGSKFNREKIAFAFRAMRFNPAIAARKGAREPQSITTLSRSRFTTELRIRSQIERWGTRMTSVESRPGIYFHCDGPVESLGHGAGGVCRCFCQERFGPGDQSCGHGRRLTDPVPEPFVDGIRFSWRTNAETAA
jgi:hypothetical protein